MKRAFPGRRANFLPGGMIAVVIGLALVGGVCWAVHYSKNNSEGNEGLKPRAAAVGPEAKGAKNSDPSLLLLSPSSNTPNKELPPKDSNEPVSVFGAVPPDPNKDLSSSTLISPKSNDRYGSESDTRED